MAQIKDLAIGDGYVYLMEDGVKVKFYVLAHNYESSLNGNGRTLFCRESPATKGAWADTADCSIGWDGYDSYKNLLYAWLRDTYQSKFTVEVKKWISTTKYYAYDAIGQCGSYSTDYPFSKITYNTAFFTVSAAEAVTSTSLADGSQLSKAARTQLEKIFSAFGSGIWTRSYGQTYSSRSSADSDGDRDYYFANGQYLSSVSSSEWGVFSTKESYSGNYGYLPCFTLPETLYIDDDGFPTEDQLPVITSTAGASGAALGTKNVPFSLTVNVTDADNDTMSLTEKIDNVTMATRTGIASGTTLTVRCLSEKALFQQIQNGTHTLTLEVNDGKTTVKWTATFSKTVTTATVSLASPVKSSSTITAGGLTIAGTFPSGSTLTVQMTNNASDSSPVWENCTDIQKGTGRIFVYHAFTNKTAANGFAFNYKVIFNRGTSTTAGNVTAIGGAIG